MNKFLWTNVCHYEVILLKHFPKRFFGVALNFKYLKISQENNHENSFKNLLNKIRININWLEEFSSNILLGYHFLPIFLKLIRVSVLKTSTLYEYIIL